MKILLIAPMLPHAEGLGAVPALLHAQIAALSERHDVTLVAGVGNELGEDEAARALLREYSDIHLTDRRPALSGPRRLQRRFRLAATWARRRWPWRTVWFADPGMQTVVDRLCRERSFDVIAVEDSSMAMFRLPEGLPKVLTEHEVRRAHDLASKPRHARDWPLWALQARDARRWESFQPAAWRRFDRIQVFTEGDARALKERAPEIASRVTVNPFGIVIPEAADPTREVPATAIFIGNFTHPPNRDAVLWLTREIMPAVLERKPDARLCIVGYSPPREVRELAGPEIEVAADVPAVQPYLERAAVVVAPVRTGGGMRMKVLRALATGKPVVTTTLGSEGYMRVGEAAPFVVADTTDAIATATARLLADERLRRDLGERARRFAVRYHSPEAWVARLEAVYQEARDARLRTG